MCEVEIKNVEDRAVCLEINGRRVAIAAGETITQWFHP